MLRKMLSEMYDVDAVRAYDGANPGASSQSCYAAYTSLWIEKRVQISTIESYHE